MGKGSTIALSLPATVPQTAAEAVVPTIFRNSRRDDLLRLGILNPPVKFGQSTVESAVYNPLMTLGVGV
jgi:hypothetical protein